ncbi:S-adenosyl-L-methionine-dependent methyltransferase [Phycomyces blakesleeanus]|uniref:S-adenosyl-L-methionine-dependent methyltransferase n=1 Tax=Phycomyces blakesleeanus TaxID=4837 RepID=A0ABR3BGH7_PHYBL
MANIEWEKRWQNGQTGWDKGTVSPALKKLIEQDTDGAIVPCKGRGLVPGCGSGYDVQFLASKNLHMTGIDLSPTCIKLCRKNHPDAAKDNYAFETGNFFDFEVPDGGYDLAYDYTFLCALEPKMRPQWASRYAEIIRPGGVLIALQYPLDGHEGGPPFSLTPEMYVENLFNNRNDNKRLGLTCCIVMSSY